ncbi:hypothetical protein PN36_16725 [Candidatus Thiomargarita nelsonii]|uniref:Uncharacterized protein n=1 Tax=Candidatus Thiomargarita nelsonii TaxID=1003181 RepID=A0A0A6PBF7_9GAMM|nr:hypothetical protein PN36_16725 [Candidatus Thiomargarita nelsonii]
MIKTQSDKKLTIGKVARQAGVNVETIQLGVFSLVGGLGAAVGASLCWAFGFVLPCLTKIKRPLLLLTMR